MGGPCGRAGRTMAAATGRCSRSAGPARRAAEMLSLARVASLRRGLDVAEQTEGSFAQRLDHEPRTEHRRHPEVGLDLQPIGHLRAAVAYAPLRARDAVR